MPSPRLPALGASPAEAEAGGRPLSRGHPVSAASAATEGPSESLLREVEGLASLQGAWEGTQVGFGASRGPDTCPLRHLGRLRADGCRPRAQGRRRGTAAASHPAQSACPALPQEASAADPVTRGVAAPDPGQ